MREPKRRFRIPNPTVLLAVGLVLVVIAVGLSVWVPYHREQVAIREIKRLGGSVGTEKGGPDWLRGLVGDEWMVGFDRVGGVTFFDEPISDDNLKYLSGLTKLENLILHYTQVSDDGLKQLSGLTRLKLLWLKGTQVSDTGLGALDEPRANLSSRSARGTPAAKPPTTRASRRTRNSGELAANQERMATKSQLAG